MYRQRDNGHRPADPWLEPTIEVLPTLEEIERFAAGERPPGRWAAAGDHRAAKILFVLTNQRYAGTEAEMLWQAIMHHEEWMAARLGRRVGITIAAMDYLTHVANQLERPVIVEEAQMGRITASATRDGLTGLYGREVFDHWLEKMVAEAQRYRTPLSLIMADIDDFKKVNDRHGHPTGDRVLKNIGAVLVENIRSADLAARYGGEELAVVLPHTEIASAETVAENIRHAIQKRFQDDLHVTISAGVAAWEPSMGRRPGRLIRAADRALYAAKRRGKNRVLRFGDRRVRFESPHRTTPSPHGTPPERKDRTRTATSRAANGLRRSRAPEPFRREDGSCPGSPERVSHPR